MNNNVDEKLKDYLKTLVSENTAPEPKKKKIPWYKKVLPKKKRR